MSTATVRDAVVKLVPGGEQSLAHLTDAEILANTRRLAGTSNKLFAALLLHLAEVEARGIHRLRSCASLYTYCIYELRMSEDAAARRSSAARLVKAFPALLDAISGGELHLTGLLMLGPHLTAENHLGVIARAKFRTKKEIAKLVRDLHPLPLVPDKMEPLGPDLLRESRAPNWAQFVDSLDPLVRSLPEGDRPADWASQTVEWRETVEPFNPVEPFKSVESLATGGAVEPSAVEPSAVEPSAVERSCAEPSDLVGPEPSFAAHWAGPSFIAPSRHEPPGLSDFTAPAAAARDEPPPITEPQRYRLEFGASGEHVRLVEKAKALLARTAPNASLGELHERAMRLLVLQLEKEKFSLTQQRSKAKAQTRNPADAERDANAAMGANVGAWAAPETEATLRHVAKAAFEVSGGDRVELPSLNRSEANIKGRIDADADADADAAKSIVETLTTADSATNHDSESRTNEAQRGVEANAATRTAPDAMLDLIACPAQWDTPRQRGQNVAGPDQWDTPRQRGRNVPAAVRREVYVRDEGRCTYLDERGARCRETRYLELHHRTPFAKGGEHSAGNLALLCAAHNALAAEEDFGREVVSRARHAAKHESLISRSAAGSRDTALVMVSARNDPPRTG